MNAKQAEEKTGITRRNLRFYEDQGLIHPRRNPENDYRDYSEEDIEVLKKIRALRMLDVTLEDISSVLKEEKTLKQIMAVQEEKLKQRRQELDTAIQFCRELQNEAPDVSTLLERMDQPQVRENLFTGWLRDYQAVARAEARKQFYFNADKEIGTYRDLTTALFAYGEKQNKEIVITKEGLPAEFTMDGIEYTADRLCYHMDHNCPSDVVICEAVHPEDFEPDVSDSRSRWLRFACHWWWLLPVGVIAIVCCILILWEDLSNWIMLLPVAVTVIWILVLEKVVFPHYKKK